MNKREMWIYGDKASFAQSRVIWFLDDLPLFSIYMILCADVLLVVFKITFPLSLLKMGYIVYNFHTRQNNEYKKRARDKLYFSIPA